MGGRGQFSSFSEHFIQIHDGGGAKIFWEDSDGGDAGHSEIIVKS